MRENATRNTRQEKSRNGIISSQNGIIFSTLRIRRDNLPFVYPPKRDNFCHPKVPRDNFRSRFGNIILLVKREPPTRNYPAVVGAQAGLERCCCARILAGRRGDWVISPYQRLPRVRGTPESLRLGDGNLRTPMADHLRLD